MSQPTNPFHAPPPHDPYGPPAREEAGSAAWGIASMITGGLAWFVCCCAIFSVPLSLAAVVLGHIAVRQPASRVTGTIGLILGYTNLLWAIVATTMSVLMPAAPAPPRVPVPESPGKAAFRQAEVRITTSGKNDFADGNTPEAAESARQFADLMKELRDEYFTPEKRKGFSLSDGNFVTWCQIRDDEICFLVHVPAYRKFTDDARKALNDLAWTAAQGAARKRLGGEATVALGMKGILLFDIVRIGVLDEDAAEDPELLYDGNDKAELIRFFEPIEAEAPAADPAAMPAAEPEPKADPSAPPALPEPLPAGAE